MDERADSELLREYAVVGSESAFEALTSRHIDFVYSVALRITVDRHLAEDVTQKVFVALAGRAASLARRTTITGWLHRTTRNVAAKTVRTEMRRRTREREAIAMEPPEQEPVWKQLAPVLDSAFDGLSEADRTVLLLRFFQKKTAAEIAARMGFSEDAAQKRVSRALDRLRVQLAREDVCLSGTALAGVLAGQAVVAAPAKLIAAASAAALTALPNTTGTLTALLEIIPMTKIKVAAAAVLIVAGVTVPLLIQKRNLKLARNENHALRSQAETFAALQKQTDTFSNQLARLQEAQRLSKAQLAELMRLRGEVALLRRDSRELAALRAEQAKAAMPEAAALNPFLPAAAWANVGAEDPQGALQTFLWAGKHRATNLVADLIRVQRDPDIPESGELDAQFAQTIIAATSWFSGRLEGFRIVSAQDTAENMRLLGIELVDHKGRMTAHNLHFLREENQWFPVMHVWLQEKGSVQAALDVPPKLQSQ